MARPGAALLASFARKWDSARPIPLGILLIHPILSRTPKPKEPTMTIEIRDASLEARIQKQLQATGSSSVEEVLLRLLESASALSS